MNKAILGNSEVVIFDKNNNFATAQVSSFFPTRQIGNRFFFSRRPYGSFSFPSLDVCKVVVLTSVWTQPLSSLLEQILQVCFYFYFFLLRYTCRVIFVAMEQVCCVYCQPSYSTCHPCTSYIITPLLLGSSSQTSNYLATQACHIKHGL